MSTGSMVTGFLLLASPPHCAQGSLPAWQSQSREGEQSFAHWPCQWAKQLTSVLATSQAFGRESFICPFYLPQKSSPSTGLPHHPSTHPSQLCWAMFFPRASGKWLFPAWRTSFICTFAHPISTRQGRICTQASKSDVCRIHSYLRFQPI